MRAAPHLLDDEERRQVVEVRFAASRRSGGADVAVDVESRAQNRRVAGAPRNLPREAARRRHAADLALRVDAVAVDRAPEVLAVDEAFAHHLDAGVVPGLRALLRAQVVQRIGAPLPLEPLLARVLIDQPFLDRDPHRAREILRALADEQMVIRFVGDELRDPRGRADALDPRDGAGALLRPVHARRVELYDALRVWQAAPADAGLVRIELDDGDARDQRVEDVGAAGHHRERLRHARDAVGVFRSVAVGRGDDAGPGTLGRHHRRRLPEYRLRYPDRSRRHRGRRLHELASIQFFHAPLREKGVVPLFFGEPFFS